MRKNKKLMLAAILLLGIGFAAVSTTLYINGNVGITANEADFDVKFTSATLDGTDISSTAISADGKTITYGTNELSMVGDKSTLDFEVTNNSELYDAEVSIECTASGTKADYYTITKEVASTIVAKTTEAGKVDVELIKATTEDITEEFTCTLTATATERTTKGEATPVASTLCQRATTLHTETCSQTSTSSYCGADGYASGDTITYGNLGTSGTLATGDAFDCDVNGDGTYDAATERFYYVSDMTNGITTDSNTAVLIYYNNVSGGEPSNSTAYAYNTNYSSTEYYGPQTAIAQLPTTTQWSNVSLTSTTRDITDEASTTRASGFSYDGYAARLLTAQEVSAGCGFTVGSMTTGELSNKCKFLMENTKYSSSTLGTYGPWLETPYSSYSRSAWDVSGNYRYVDSDTVSGASGPGVRPAIEVLKSNISY